MPNLHCVFGGEPIESRDGESSEGAETRLTTGTIFTDKLFTGQREMAGLGIYHYGARFYSPKLGRFLSPDTIVQNFANPQTLNRFSYVINNPLRYTDPTGHVIPCEEGDVCQHPDPSPAPGGGGSGGGGGNGGGSPEDNCNNNPDCLFGDSVPAGWSTGVYCITSGCYFDGGPDISWTLEDWPTITVAVATAGCFVSGLCVSIVSTGTYSIYYNSVLTCLKIPLCASAIGAGGGVTVLGKIKPGEIPPGYVKIGNQINGRTLHTPNWTPELQAKFMEETKALGNPVFLADNPNLYPHSVLATEVNDLLKAGWTMILNTMMYPPK